MGSNCLSKETKDFSYFNDSVFDYLIGVLSEVSNLYWLYFFFFFFFFFNTEVFPFKLRMDSSYP